MTSRILCATDFSAESSRASDAAAALAAKTGEGLTLVHVSGTCEAADEGLSSALHLAAEERLRAEADRLRETGAEVAEVVLDGSPSSALLDYLEESPGRLLVVASGEKRTFSARWFSGGLIERLARNSKIPTLVLRDPVVLEEWLGQDRPLRITIEVGSHASSDVPLQWLADLARIGPCEVTAVYLHWVPEETLRLGLPDTSLFENSRQLQMMLERELRERTAEVLGDLPVTIRVEPRWGRADLPLLGLAEAAGADLIIVGARRKKGISRLVEESVSTGLLHHSPLNLAIIPLVESTADRSLPVYDHLLVPTDFSDTSNLAVFHAAAMASPGATVHLLHVRDRVGVSASESMERLRALIPREALERGIRFETVVEDGRVPSETILQVAARRMVDVICMGSAGRNAISKVLLGSVASQVTAGSPRPVLLVPKPM